LPASFPVEIIHHIVSYRIISYYYPLLGGIASWGASDSTYSYTFSVAWSVRLSVVCLSVRHIRGPCSNRL